MRLGRRFYMTLVLIILLMGIGYAFAPFFTIGQCLSWPCRCWWMGLCSIAFVASGLSVSALPVSPTEMRTL